MHSRRLMLSVAAIGILAVFAIGIAIAQQGGGGGARGGFDPAQMRQRTMDRVKEALAPTDEEWKVLEPKLAQVVTIQSDMSRTLRMSTGRRPSDAAGGEEQLSELGKAAQDLRATLDNKEAKAEDIKAKLTAVRTARDKAKQELAKAQASLLESVNAKQEANLVLMAMLD